jgi:inorganic pyrophosphatase
MSKKGDPSIYEVVIETPKGCRNKYVYDKKKEHFKLKKIMPLGAVFPFDFGFIPSTKAEDGDPVDILVIMDEPAFPGCVIDCRIIGALKARQSEGEKMIENDRLIGVAMVSEIYNDIKEAKDLNKNVKDQIQHFFVSYNEEEGKKFEPQGWVDAAAALEMIKKAE